MEKTSLEFRAKSVKSTVCCKIHNLKADDTQGNFLSNVAVNSTTDLKYPDRNSQWESARATLLNKFAHCIISLKYIFHPENENYLIIYSPMSSFKEILPIAFSYIYLFIYSNTTWSNINDVNVTCQSSLQMFAYIMQKYNWLMTDIKGPFAHHTSYHTSFRGFMT